MKTSLKGNGRTLFFFFNPNETALLLRGTGLLRIGHVSLILCFNTYRVRTKRHRGGRQVHAYTCNIINTSGLATVLFYDQYSIVFVALLLASKLIVLLPCCPPLPKIIASMSSACGHSSLTGVPTHCFWSSGDLTSLVGGQKLLL